MKCTITIDMNNAAFTKDSPCNGQELSEILERLAIKVVDTEWCFGQSIRLFDTNGNTVGEAVFTEEFPDENW